MEETAVFAKLKKDLYELVDDPDNLDLQRKIYDDLINSLRKVKGKEFAICLLYKGILEDILRQCMEDDYLENKIVKESVKRLALTVVPLSEGKWDDFFERLREFGDVYSRIPSKRLVKDQIEIRNILFSVSTLERDKILIGKRSDWPFFVNMDKNLCCVERNREISKWYIKAIEDLRKQLQEELDDIDVLCFIEKSYSDVGAIGLMSLLVSRLNLPAIIYRHSHWDPKAKISANDPFIRNRACIVYDVVISGSMVEQAAQYLERNYDIETKAAVVLFEYDGSKARKTLERKGIKLISCLKYSQIKDEIERQIDLVKVIRRSCNRVIRGFIEEEDAEQIQKAIHQYLRDKHLAKKKKRGLK